MIQLFKGDCLEVMKQIPDGSVDAIITDPPYGTTACKWDSVIPFDLMWEQLNRIIKPNGDIVLFGSEPFSSLLRVSNLGVEVYGKIKGLKDFEIINESGLRNPRSVQYFRTAESEGKFHPTQKPVALMEYLIKTYTNPQETVLDFTMGSGSTGVAAVNTGRKFIGIEMDDRYFEIAEQRINENNLF